MAGVSGHVRGIASYVIGASGSARLAGASFLTAVLLLGACGSSTPRTSEPSPTTQAVVTTTTRARPKTTTTRKRVTATTAAPTTVPHTTPKPPPPTTPRTA